MLSASLEYSINLLFRHARDKSYEFVTIEQLLQSIIHDNKCTNFINLGGKEKSNINKIARELEEYINEHTPIITNKKQETQPTLGFQRVIQRAVYHVQATGRGEVEPINILVAIYGEQESEAVLFLNNLGLSRSDLVDYISGGTHKRNEVLKDFAKGKKEEFLDESFDYKSILRLKDQEIKSMKLKFKMEKKKRIAEISRAQKNEKKLSKKIALLESQLEISSETTIVRSLQFESEHIQAGISILNYFSEVIKQKYPEKTVTITIEQSDLTVRLCIKTKCGDKEIIEKTLDSYGGVVTGSLMPNEFLTNSIDIAKLENKLEMAKLEIKANERLLNIQNETICILNQSLKSLCKINDISQNPL